MKTPRIRDFDPNAASVPELGSPLDSMPRIERPHPVTPESPALSASSPRPIPAAFQLPQQTSERANARTPTRTPERSPKRRIITRNSFEIYEDQMESLRKLAYEEKMEGGVGSMSRMVRDAIDHYLTSGKPSKD